MTYSFFLSGIINEEIQMSKRTKIKYPGVYYRDVTRIGSSGIERVYFIRFKREGKVIEEKVEGNTLTI